MLCWDWISTVEARGRFHKPVDVADIVTNPRKLPKLPGNVGVHSGRPKGFGQVRFLNARPPPRESMETVVIYRFLAFPKLRCGDYCLLATRSR